MSEAQQATVESACKATMLDGMALGEAIQFDYMKANVESGVTNHYWSDEMLATFQEKWLEVVDELVAEDPEFGVSYGALNEFRANYKIWQEWIYLPRPSKQGQ